MANFSARGEAQQLNVAGNNSGTINLTSVHQAPRPVVNSALRRDVSAFIGRDTELSRILYAAEPGRVVSIHTVDGMPGVGKTALVTRAAHVLADRFPDGRYFVELHAHTPGQTPAAPTNVLAGLLTDLGIDPRNIPDTLDGRRNLWRDRLTNKRVLLVLDDARDPTQIEPLLPTSPGCLTLITSRRRLIALDDALPMALDILDPASAADLFTTLAHRAPTTDAERAAVSGIVELCGYLPLAIVLLAGRMAHHRTWTIPTLAAQFAATTDRLAELDTGDRAVHAAFTMSYRDLPPQRQMLFRRLGSHPGPDTDTAAAAALADIPTAVARRELEALYTDHLIDETTPGRYRLHDLLREYARTLAATDPLDNQHRAINRLLDYYHASATAANRHLARYTRPIRHSAPQAVASSTVQLTEFENEVQALAWMRIERANLLACVEHTATDQPRRTVELTGVLAELLDRDGPRPQARQLHRRATAMAGVLGDRLGEALALNDLGSVHERTGDFAEAAALFQQSLALFEEIGDRLGKANTLTNLGLVRQWTGSHIEAGTVYEHALFLFREVGDRLGEAHALNKIGGIHQWIGSYAEAAALYQRALLLFREVGNRLGEAHALTNIGLVHQWIGSNDEAASLFEQSLAIFREIDNRLGEANVLNNIGLVHQRAGHYAEASALYLEALPLFRGVGDRRGEAHALNNIGLVHQRIGHYTEAAPLFRQALSLNREIGNRLGEAHALNNIGLVHQGIEDYAKAAPLFQQALAIFREIGNRLGEAEVLNYNGSMLVDSGELRNALTVFTDALSVACQIHSQLEQAHALEGVARCLAGLGDTDAAIAQLREAIEIYERLRAPESDRASAYLAILEPSSQ